MHFDSDALISSLTIDQKAALLGGHDNWHTVSLPGIPAMRCSDGPAGVRGTSWTGPASASFPCGTALGATFDTELVERVGRALGVEARSKGVHMLLAPTVNLHRTPIGGRNFECMSEDPVLTAAIAVGYIRGVQENGVGCCIKHFVGNDTEFERMTISSDIDERTLRELYLVPFEAAARPVERGGAGVQAMMTGYNRLNGSFCSEHEWLLRTVLRGDWGWTGVLVSDWFGTHSTAAALEAGLDLEMPGPVRHRGEALAQAIRTGTVEESRADESIRRLLRFFEWSGVGEIDSTERTDDSPATRAVIRDAAIAATVLLKNERDLLPLPAGTSVAVVGPNGEGAQVQGGGSAKVRAHRTVGIVDALNQRGISTTFRQGCSIDKRLPALRGEFTVTLTGASGDRLVTDASRLALMWQDAPSDTVGYDAAISVRGTFTPLTTGEWRFGVCAVGAATLRVNGERVVHIAEPMTGGTFFGIGSPEQLGIVTLQAGEPVTIDIEMPAMPGTLLRGLLVGGEGPSDLDSIDRAAASAAAADVAVVVVGTNDDWEAEGEDRVTMQLPGEQDDLIRRVAAANPNTVVVVNAGSPVTMPWLNDVGAVLQVWFPGAEFGNSLADVLFGDAEPGGRLPVTIPRRLEDTPAYTSYPGEGGHARYDEGLHIGYRWYHRQRIEPLFPFGFGLGYTTWQLDEASVDGAIDAAIVSVTVTNCGARRGSHIVQVYVEPPAGDPLRPSRTLQAFRKVTLNAGDTTRVEIPLDVRAFRAWHDGWTVPPGVYTVLVGSSSTELSVAGSLTSS